MITQKQIKEWCPGIIESFLKAKPDITIPIPEIYIVTKITWERIRASLVEKLHSNQISPGPDAGMETIHGSNGDAILIYQHKLNSHVNGLPDFRHFLWHELGHFYAISKEDPALNRFMDQKPHPDEYEALRGYYFWAEFIAETIACDVEPQPDIDWSNVYFSSIRNTLGYHLYQGTSMTDEEMIDWYNLSFYFARILSDKMILGYLKAAEDGTLKYRRTYDDKHPVSLCEAGIDPYCLDLVDESTGLIIKDIKDILSKQLKKDNPYDVSLETVTELGECLISIERNNKIKEFADRLRMNQKQ